MTVTERAVIDRREHVEGRSGLYKAKVFVEGTREREICVCERGMRDALAHGSRGTPREQQRSHMKIDLLPAQLSHHRHSSGRAAAAAAQLQLLLRRYNLARHPIPLDTQ